MIVGARPSLRRVSPSSGSRTDVGDEDRGVVVRTAVLGEDCAARGSRRQALEIVPAKARRDPVRKHHDAIATLNVTGKVTQRSKLAPDDPGRQNDGQPRAVAPHLDVADTAPLYAIALDDADQAGG